jgi:hypothetical protein
MITRRAPWWRKPERGESPLLVRHLERPPLGTYYPEQVARIKELLRDPALRTESYDYQGKRTIHYPP